ncbi:MAG: aspartate/glutamate racemase family protein [Dehalococcoidales bacterium]|nr:aspartate/glutamate racemase family protein [Dehalococcoidales bacterium]
MYGWRARLGVLVPSGNIVTEPEFNTVVPEGVCCHYHRYKFGGDIRHRDGLNDVFRAADYIVEASKLMADVQPSVVAMTGTGTSFIGGYHYDQKIIEKMKAVNADIPATTTSTSVIDALKRMGIKKISIAMPYLEEVAKAAVKFVEANGILVQDAKWLNLAGFEIHRVSQETLRQLAKAVDTPESEALFISCTSLHTFEIIEKLETDLGKPVITSNQVTIWNMLRLAGINDKIAGYGQLLSQY